MKDDEKNINEKDINKTEKIKKSIVNKLLLLKGLFLLVIILLFNSYAWFIYATKVEGGLSAHVTAWKVDFKVGNEDAVTSVVLDVDKIYPGMITYEQEIQVINKGEREAELKYKFNSLNALGVEYKVGTNITQEELDNKIANEFPFKISVTIDQKKPGINQNEQSFYIVTVTWPYESGNDELDTIWGEKAYEFEQKNPKAKSLIIGLDLIAEQKESVIQ